MWESIVVFFTILKSKNCRLPLSISLGIIGIIIALSYVVMNQPVPTPERQTLQSSLPPPPKLEMGPTPTPQPEQQQNPKPVLGSKKSLVQTELKEEEQQEEEEPVSNYPRFTQSLEDTLQREGIDRDLAKKVTVKIKSDFLTQKNDYDLRESIKSVMGPEATDSEVLKIHQLVLNSASSSFSEMEARGELTVE